MTHGEKIAQWIGPGKIGTEIGAGASPLPGLDPRPVYVDCFKSFGAESNRADYYGHACRLPFHDHALDYVVASHVLEHVANPVAALAEWYRVVRPGGIIYLVVPHRQCTWDQPRALTTLDHLLADYVRGTTACDPTHIDEFAQGIDWTRFNPSTPGHEIPAKRTELACGLHETIARGEDINIHFHTFEPDNLRSLLNALTVWPPRRLRWELVDLADGFPAECPNGILAVLRVHKGWLARAEADAFRLRTGGDPRTVLREDAEPFATWAARTPGLGGVK
jgi:SAM-dependent methyltransferase